MNPLVSVIIPNYNHEKFLTERIEAVINQTYHNFEIIILDDCSADNSKVVIESYRQHPKVSSILYNAVNSGSPFSQWKAGIEVAKGKYCWIAESDDTCRVNFLENLVSFLEKNAQLKLVFSDSERSELEWRKIPQDSKPQLQIFKDTDFVIQKMLTSPTIVNASAVVFRRDGMQRTFFEQSNNYKSAFDWLFWCLVIKGAYVAFYPAKLNYFRQHLQNTSIKAAQQGRFVFEGLRAVAAIKDYYKISLNQEQLKIWASVWAQTSVVNKQFKKLFLQTKKQAWKVSPKLLMFFTYYLFKYRFLSAPNIQTCKSCE